MRFLAVLFAALLAACAAAPVTTPIPLLLTFSDGTCSGSAIAPHAILTATHCFDGSTVKLSGLIVRKRIDDGNDRLAGGGVIEEWAETKPFRFTAAQWSQASQ